jgi:ribA/ribD-fused uncharacterized protein
MINEFRGPTRWLSNFQSVEIEYEGITYPTTEHAYQAAKTLDPEERYIISKLPTPGAAKKQGRLLDIRPDWDSIKFDVMLEITRKKFSNLELKAKLINTGDQELVEGNNWGDTYWGVCNGIGQNNLGKILMTVRDECRL